MQTPARRLREYPEPLPSRSPSRSEGSRGPPEQKRLGGEVVVPSCASRRWRTAHSAPLDRTVRGYRRCAARALVGAASLATRSPRRPCPALVFGAVGIG